MPTGSELFIRSLKSQGVDTLFTLVGDHLNDVLQVAAREGMRIFDTRHESAAVHMADGWSRMTGNPGVSIVTGAPGHTNSITGIATADATGVPVLTISGMSTSQARDRNAFQDQDQLKLVQGITKYAAVPARAGQIPFHVKRAYLEMKNGRPGVAHLSIPVDLLKESVDTHYPIPDGPIEPNRPGPDSRDIDRVVGLLSSAKRPVVIAGAGAHWSGAGDELKAFIEAANVPLFTISLARGLVSDDHPLCFGYADATLNRGAETALRQADLVIVIGKRIDYRLRLGSAQLFSDDAKFVQVDTCGEELGLNRDLEVGIAADAKVTLAALNEALAGDQAPDRSDWLAEVQSGSDAYATEVAALTAKPSDPMHSLHLYQALKDKVPEDATICWDGGDFVHWGRYTLKARRPGHWLRLGSLAGLGVALPLGLTAKILRPNSPSIVITGDGSVGFYIGEFDTAVRFGLPIIVIVGNDGGWGIERELQKGFYPETPTVACELRRTRYDLVMKGFGGDGAHVTSPDQLPDAIDRALRTEVPFCLNVDIAGAGSPFTQYQLRNLKK
jgi:acetolactate synthase-1/2/3 large subunit